MVAFSVIASTSDAAVSCNSFASNLAHRIKAHASTMANRPNSRARSSAKAMNLSPSLAKRYCALVRAWDASPRSPMVWRRGKFNRTHSNQTAERQSAIAGGLICVQDCDDSFDCSPVDHDWRGTLNTAFTANLLMRTWSSSNVYNGSGFSNRTAGITDSNGALISPYQGDYLPAHTTFDVSAGKSFGESLRLAVDVRSFVINSTSERDAETSIKSSCKTTSCDQSTAT